MAINKDGDDARQGSNRPFMLRVLLIGIALAVAGFFIVGMFTSTEQMDQVPTEQPSDSSPAEQSGEGSSGAQQ